MATTLQWKSKRVLYVGGLANDVKEATLRAAMIPFGPIQSIDVPLDYVKGVHRGFGFVEYEDVDDAAEAIYNMDGAELMGKTLSVSLAQANQLKSAAMSHKSKQQQAVWSTDEWFQKYAVGMTDDATKEREERQQADDTKQLSHAVLQRQEKS